MMAARRDVVKKLLEDPEVVAKVDAAKTWSEAFDILAEEGRKRGFKVKTVELGQ